MTETDGPTTFTWTAENGLSTEQSGAPFDQERNTLKGPAARALGIPPTEAPSPEDYVDDIDDDYDWADDPNMSAEKTLRRIKALGPDITIGPDS